MGHVQFSGKFVELVLSLYHLDVCKIEKRIWRIHLNSRRILYKACRIHPVNL